MPDAREFLIFALAALVTGLGLWLLIAGDREGDIVDEEPTLNVQNHKDDE